jgi:CHRD domain-containing protein
VIDGTCLLAEGKLTSFDLQGSVYGKQILDLVNIVKNRQAYVNIHTKQNPNGEILGQIKSNATRVYGFGTFYASMYCIMRGL